MRGPSPLPMLRRRPLTATQVCSLPEREPSAAAFYEPPRDGDDNVVQTPKPTRAEAA